MSIKLPADGRLRAVTIVEPFATLIAMGIKTIESRSLPFPRRYPFPMTVAIHAGSNDDYIGTYCQDLATDPIIAEAFNSPDFESFVPGRDYFYGSVVVGLIDIVASVDLRGCDDDEIVHRLASWPTPSTSPHYGIDESRLEWANGDYAWVLDNPRRFRTGVCVRGQQNLWSLPPDVQAEVLRQSVHVLERHHDLPSLPWGGSVRFLGRPRDEQA